jgi:uncharacterized membrane protein YeaQ/YmgE (transglycosylase-associated protein family)
VSAVVGFVGAFWGLWLARQFGLPEFYTISVGGEIFPVIWSIIGSFVLAMMVGFLKLTASNGLCAAEKGPLHKPKSVGWCGTVLALKNSA